jgi:hypothetical protein
LRQGKVAGLAYDSEHGKLWQDIKAALDKTRARASKFADDAEWAFGKRTARVLGVVLTTIILILLVILLSDFGIVSSDNAVIVGAVLALVGVLITQMVNTFNARDTQKHQQKLEDQRAQDNALQKYLDQVSEKETYEALRKAAEGGYKRAVMLAKMKTLLLALDVGRKSILLLFLNDAKLIKKKQYLRSKDKRGGWNYPILELKGINFSGAKLDDSVEMEFTDLSGANLSKTDLSGATFRGVNLHDADLSGTNLSKTKLLRAPPPESEEAKKEAAERIGPPDELLKMDLSKADLSGADLSGADLSGADLSGADLSGANLQDAKITDKQLADTLSLQSATMPYGSKHS